MILNDDYWGTARWEYDTPLGVFCVDPGETTGWVFAEVWAGHKPEIMQVWHGEVEMNRLYSGIVSSSDPTMVMSLYRAERYLCNEMLRRMCVAHDQFQLQFVVIEDFLLRERTMNRNLLSPVRLTAGLHNDLDDSDLKVELYIQSSSDMSIITDEQLRSNECWFRGQQHARDAARHLLLFMRKLETYSD